MIVDILTPNTSLYSGEATSVIVPGTEGSMGFLNNHAPMITSLKAGEVKLKTNDGENKTFTINGGVAEVLKNKVIILAE